MKYDNILDNYINGNKKDAVQMIDEYGWYNFANTVEADETLTPMEKVKLLAATIRIKCANC